MYTKGISTKILTTLIIVLLVIAGASTVVLLNILNKPTTVTVAQTSTQITGVERYVAIEDMVGKTVKVPVAVRRVVVLQSYWVEVIHLLGSGDKIVGIGKSAKDSVWVPDYLKNKTVVGDIFSGVNVETVVSLKPDVVITDVGYGKAEEIIKSLEDLGIPVVRMFCQSFKDQLKAIEILGKIFNASVEAEELINYLTTKFSGIKEIASKIPDEKKPRVLMLSSVKEGLVSVYSNSTWGRAVEDVGGVNIALREFPTQAWPKVNVEKVLAWNPDVIIVVAFDLGTLNKTIQMMEGSPWNMTNAVRNGKIYGVLAGSKYREAFLDWGPRMLIGYMQLAKIIQPGYFKDLDWRKEADELLAKFYKMKLYITVKDVRGKEITLPYPVKKVVVLRDAIARIVATLDAFDRVIGISQDIAEDKVIQRVVPNIMELPITAPRAASTVNMELLLTLKPDVVLMWGMYPKVVEAVESLGIPVIVVHPKNYTQVREGILTLGKVFGREDRAKEVIALMDEVMSLVRNRTAGISESQRLKALFVMCTLSPKLLEKPYVWGWGTLSGQGLELAGLIDVTKGALQPRGAGEVPLETILGWNPDVIFLNECSEEDLYKIYNNSIWRQINAVKHGKIFILPRLLNPWTPEYALQILYYAVKAYPDIFKDVNFNKFFREFTEKIYGVPLEPYYE